jgi:hypothetical protein
MTDTVQQLHEDARMFEAILLALIGRAKEGKIVLPVREIADYGNTYRLCVQANHKRRTIMLTMQEAFPRLVRPPTRRCRRRHPHRPTDPPQPA